jgi:hypothetical protein
MTDLKRAIEQITTQLNAITAACNVAQSYHICADTPADKRMYAVTVRGLKAMREDKQRQLREAQALRDCEFAVSA